MSAIPRKPGRTLGMIWLVLSVAAAGAVHAESKPSPNKHLLSVELGYMLPALNVSDAYVGGYRYSLSYERHSLFEGIPLGVGALWAMDGLVPAADFFFASPMLEAGLMVLLDFRRVAGSGVELSMAPYVGYRHYFRYLRYMDDESYLLRPAAMAGLKLRLIMPNGYVYMASLEYDLYIDNTAIHILAVTVGTGEVR